MEPTKTIYDSIRSINQQEQQTAIIHECGS